MEKTDKAPALSLFCEEELPEDVGHSHRRSPLNRRIDGQRSLMSYFKAGKRVHTNASSQEPSRSPKRQAGTNCRVREEQLMSEKVTLVKQLDEAEERTHRMQHEAAQIQQQLQQAADAQSKAQADGLCRNVTIGSVYTTPTSMCSNMRSACDKHKLHENATAKDVWEVLHTADSQDSVILQILYMRLEDPGTVMKHALNVPHEECTTSKELLLQRAVLWVGALALLQKERLSYFLTASYVDVTQITEMVNMVKRHFGLSVDECSLEKTHENIIWAARQIEQMLKRQFGVHLEEFVWSDEEMDDFDIWCHAKFVVERHAAIESLKRDRN